MKKMEKKLKRKPLNQLWNTTRKNSTVVIL